MVYVMQNDKTTVLAVGFMSFAQQSGVTINAQELIEDLSKKDMRLLAIDLAPNRQLSRNLSGHVKLIGHAEWLFEQTDPNDWEKGDANQPSLICSASAKFEGMASGRKDAKCDFASRPNAQTFFANNLAALAQTYDMICVDVPNLESDLMHLVAPFCTTLIAITRLREEGCRAIDFFDRMGDALDERQVTFAHDRGAPYHLSLVEEAALGDRLVSIRMDETRVDAEAAYATLKNKLN